MKLLEKQIEYVIKNIPYYMRFGFESTDCLDKIPVVTKPDIKNRYEDFISCKYEDIKSELVKFLQNDKIRKNENIDNEIEFSPDIIVEETSGTSGVPFRCAKTKEERMKISLAIWKQRWKFDKQLNHKNFYQFNHIGINSHIKYNIYDYSINNLINLYSDIADSEYRWLHAPPSVLRDHCRLLQDRCIHFDFKNLKFIECNGQYLDEDTKNIIEKYFNAKVINQYGLIETWAIGIGCCNDKIHLNEDNIYLEIVDDDFNVITEPEKEGRIVVTTLINKLFPFIRYLTGDYGYYNKDQCPCGLGGKTITLIQGRDINLIKGYSGKIFGNIIFHQIMRGIHRRLDGIDISYVQVIQTGLDEFEVYTNPLHKRDEFIKMFRNFTCFELGKEVVIRHIELNEEELKKRASEKPNIFICKC